MLKNIFKKLDENEKTLYLVVLLKKCMWSCTHSSLCIDKNYMVIFILFSPDLS